MKSSLQGNDDEIDWIRSDQIDEISEADAVFLYGYRKFRFPLQKQKKRRLLVAKSLVQTLVHDKLVLSSILLVEYVLESKS